MASRFGPQPAHWMLDRERYTIRRAATELGVQYQHLSRALRGYARPDDVVREKLPKLLHQPLEALFTEEALKPFIVRRPRKVLK